MDSTRKNKHHADKSEQQKHLFSIAARRRCDNNRRSLYIRVVNQRTTVIYNENTYSSCKRVRTRILLASSMPEKKYET